jgi:hemoglobin/transferrin/lactoferrin receptor protein
MGKHGPEEYLRKEYVEGHEGEDVVVPNSDDRMQVPTAYNQLSILQKLRYSPNSDLDFLYTFTYSNTTDFDRYDRLIMYRSNLPRSAEWYYGPNLWMMNALSVSYSKPNILFSQATLKLAAQLFKESRHDRNFNASTLRHRYEQVWAYNMQMDFSKEFSMSTRLLYGIDFIYNKINSEGVNTNVNTQVSEEGPTRYPQSDWTSAGAFASLQHRFSAKVLANAGLRYTHYGLQAEFDTKFYPFPYEEASLSNGAINGSIGLVYNPSEKWTFSTNLSTGFRSPNIDDMGKVFDSEPGSVIVPNPALKAEYATNVDLAIAHYIGERIKLDATAFYTWLDDALVRRPFLLSGNDSILYDGELSRVLAIQNAARASVYGVQAGFEAKLPLGFALRSSLSWQKGEEELDDGSKSPLRHAAPIFGLTKLSFSTIRFRTELSLYYNSEVPHNKLPEEEKSKAYMYALDDNGLPYSPAWYTLNLKSMYKLNDAFTFTAGCENITNQRYRPYSSGIVAAGSNLIFSVIFSF